MARLGRTYSPRPHVAQPIVAPGGPVVVTRNNPHTQAAAILRPLANSRRRVLRPHLAQPIVAPGAPVVNFHLPVYSQGTQRTKTGRTVPRPHLAQPIVATASTAPFAPTIFIGWAAKERAKVHRRLPRLFPLPTLGQPKPVARGTFKFQALRRNPTTRTVPEAHVAPPNLTQSPPAPLVLSRPGGRVAARTTGQRPRRALRPWLAQPVAGVPAVVAPFSPGTFKRFQSLRRATITRTVPKAHVAAPTLSTAAPPPLAAGTYRFQSLRRNPTTRATPKAHVAPNTLRVQVPPVNPGSFVLLRQQLTRLVGRWFPKVHVGPPIVGPYVPPPIPPVPPPPDWPPKPPYPVTSDVGVDRSSGKWMVKKDLFRPTRK